MTRLFLIDDHAIVREGLRALLEKAGHRVVGEAWEPTPAVAAVQQTEPEVVLLDLGLGDRSGFEILHDIRTRQLPVKTVVLSVSDQPHQVVEAIRLGASGYVLKGSPSAELLEAIEHAGRGERYLPARLAPEVQRLLDDERSGRQPLSPRERQVLVMVARGASSNAIGEALHLSPKTVDSYRSRLMAKLGLADVTAVVRWAIREGLVGLDGS